MFVHQRILGYKSQGLFVDIYVCNPGVTVESRWTYEGIVVTAGGAKTLERCIRYGGYEKILIHFISDAMMEALSYTCTDTPLIVWVHGHEAMSWRRRWFFFSPFLMLGRKFSSLSGQRSSIEKKDILYYCGKYAAQLTHMRKLRRFIISNESRMEFVFVSSWMRRIVESDLRIRFIHVHIIHNPVDTARFAYSPKDSDKRFHLLTIRPFSNRKYANDTTIRAIRLLARKPYFSRYNITIVGSGPYFKPLTAPLQRYPNVTLVNRFLHHEEIIQFHADNGVFLCPTRQDAQGVSMCEAMASGLVCISSDNSAIPEFLPESTGFRTRNAKGIVKAIELMVDIPERFSILSKNASDFIRTKCDLSDIIKKEIDLIKKGISFDF